MFKFFFYYINIIPVLIITFVSILILFKVYIKIRSKFKVGVNCWFCNGNTKVPYELKNSWECPICEQYNGFTNDGDYNREILAQYEPNSALKSLGNGYDTSTIYGNDHYGGSYGNGFCEACNENQRIKVEKLAQFEPKSEFNYDEELIIFKLKLEEKYRLCLSCERHLRKILRDKKKIILGAKLSSFLSRGKKISSVFNRIRFETSRNGKIVHNIISISLFALSLINLSFIINEIVTKNNEIFRAHHQQHNLHQDSPSSYTEKLSFILFLLISHIFAFGKVILEYLNLIFKIHIIEKFYLYIRTLSILLYYTFGHKLNYYENHNGKENDLFWKGNFLTVVILPFLSLFLVFLKNAMNKFKIPRNILLLTFWSLHICLININFSTSVNKEGSFLLNCIQFFISLTIMLLSYPRRNDNNPLSLNESASSFHRIHSEDYLNNDDETASTTTAFLYNSSFKDFSDLNDCQSNSNIVNRTNSYNSSSSIKSHSFSNRNIENSLNIFNNNKDHMKKASSLLNLSNSSAFKEYSSKNSFGSNNRFINSSNMNNRYQMTTPNCESFLSSPSSCKSFSGDLRNTTLINNNFNLNTSNPILNRTSSPLPEFTALMKNQNSCFNKSINDENRFLSLSSITAPARCFNEVNSISGEKRNDRQNLLSPSRLIINNTNGNNQIISQTSWVCGGYFNKPSLNIMNIGMPSLLLPSQSVNEKRNFFVNNTPPLSTAAFNVNSKDPLSRSSSQSSSGFESQTSNSALLVSPSDYQLQQFQSSRENSYCRELDGGNCISPLTVCDKFSSSSFTNRSMDPQKCSSSVRSTTLKNNNSFSKDYCFPSTPKDFNQNGHEDISFGNPFLQQQNYHLHPYTQREQHQQNLTQSPFSFNHPLRCGSSFSTLSTFDTNDVQPINNNTRINRAGSIASLNILEPRQRRSSAVFNLDNINNNLPLIRDNSLFSKWQEQQRQEKHNIIQE